MSATTLILCSQNSSWALDEEENEHLRQRFPNVNGHLFEVVLHMGQTGLGESVCVCKCRQILEGG